MSRFAGALRFFIPNGALIHHQPRAGGDTPPSSGTRAPHESPTGAFSGGADNAAKPSVSVQLALCLPASPVRSLLNVPRQLPVKSLWLFTAMGRSARPIFFCKRSKTPACGPGKGERSQFGNLPLGGKGHHAGCWAYRLRCRRLYELFEDIQRL